MEIIVECVECGSILEQNKTTIKWGDVVIQVIPCDCINMEPEIAKQAL